MADLNEFEVLEEALPLVLLHPVTKEELLNDDERPMTVYLYGFDSKVAKRASSEIKSRHRDGKKLTEAEIKKNSVDMLARCTHRFENVQFGGEIIKADHKQCTALYNRYNWMFEQCAEFVGIRANHLGNLQND